MTSHDAGVAQNKVYLLFRKLYHSVEFSHIFVKFELVCPTAGKNETRRCAFSEVTNLW